MVERRRSALRHPVVLIGAFTAEWSVLVERFADFPWLSLIVTAQSGEGTLMQADFVVFLASGLALRGDRRAIGALIVLAVALSWLAVALVALGVPIYFVASWQKHLARTVSAAVSVAVPFVALAVVMIVGSHDWIMSIRFRELILDVVARSLSEHPLTFFSAAGGAIPARCCSAISARRGRTFGTRAGTSYSATISIR